MVGPAVDRPPVVRPPIAGEYSIGKGWFIDSWISTIPIPTMWCIRSPLAEFRPVCDEQSESLLCPQTDVQISGEQRGLWVGGG